MASSYLQDGEKHVRALDVLCLVNDNEEWLRYALPQLSHLERSYPDTRFAFYFYENGSRDQTVPLILDFLSARLPPRQQQEAGNEIEKNTERRRGTLLRGPDHGGRCSGPSNRGTTYERTHRMSILRNEILTRVKQYENICHDAPPLLFRWFRKFFRFRREKAPLLLRAQWALLLDSDIYFATDILEKMFRCAPRKHNIGVVTPFTSALDSSGRDTGHYYDTYAFVDMNSHNYRPSCVFRRCPLCHSSGDPAFARPPFTTPLLVDDGSEKEDNVLEVKSAFGGFALVDAEVLNHPETGWDTLDYRGEYATCEHVLFCEGIRKSTGKKTVVCLSTAGRVHWRGDR